MNQMQRFFAALLAVAALSTAGSGQVVINECFTGVPDWCEILNLGTTTVDIGNWTLIMTDDPTTSTVFSFPVGTMIAPGELIVVTESTSGPGVPAGTQVFISTVNINWAGPGSPTDPDGACALNDAGGAGVDLVIFGSPSLLPTQNPASPFTGLLPLADDYARNSLTDNDNATDWSGSPNASPGSLNIGQIVVPSATLPYTQDFDNGPLGPEWLLNSSTTSGRMQILPGNPASPLSGGNNLVFDVAVQNLANTNTATLFVDISSPNVILRYYAREAGDEADPTDGCFLSDGTTTVQVADHTTLTSNWEEITVDISGTIAANGMNASSQFQIIFSQTDNYPAPTDGLLIDDVRVFALVSDTGQANSSDASLDVNGGLNLNTFPANPGQNGPFFASGNTLDLTVGGGAGQPFILVFGPLNRNNLTGSFGSLDVGMAPDLSDVLFLMNGIAPASLFDQLAVLGPAGQADFHFGLEGVPPGVLGTFQVAVQTASSPFVQLSAAFEFSVTP